MMIAEFRDLAVRRVTRRIKKNRVYIIVPPPYIRAAGSDNRTLTHRRPSTIFYLNRLKFLRSQNYIYEILRLFVYIGFFFFLGLIKKYNFLVSQFYFIYRY
jgi:hypothetical protein